MSKIILYDPDTGAVKQYLPRANTPKYAGKPGVLINPEGLDELTNERGALLHEQVFIEVSSGRVALKKPNEVQAIKRRRQKELDLGHKGDAGQAVTQELKMLIADLEISEVGAEAIKDLMTIVWLLETGFIELAEKNLELLEQYAVFNEITGVLKARLRP